MTRRSELFNRVGANLAGKLFRALDFIYDQLESGRKFRVLESFSQGFKEGVFGGNG
ncbi:MAG: hypothetical protein N3A56_02620 [Thermodesulfobacteriaceae bacterium]|nr:hypothetical protein [Thermodesulfobacteriaceae bacterium]MDW8135870.1 hypothetical protein [Thermodesulfobacterium sp.]